MSEQDILDAITDVQDKVNDMQTEVSRLEGIQDRVTNIEGKVIEIKAEQIADKVYAICDACLGTGKIWNYPSGPTDPSAYSYICPKCEGNGKYEWGQQKT